MVADDFRGSGLSHLLVVSGENVAFVVAAAGPLLRRLGPRARWVATVVVLVVFAALTRFEPSVLRATAMALIGVTAWSLGRPASGLRILGLAVTALVLVDPMLVGVAGFQLSVAASAGIIVAAQPAGRAASPSVGWRPAAVTVAAQVAVSPILIAFYGGLPVATLPANLLAEHAAGLLMGWGIAAVRWPGWWADDWPRRCSSRPARWSGGWNRWLGGVRPRPWVRWGPWVWPWAGTALAWVAVHASRHGRARVATASWVGLVGVLAWPALALARAAWRRPRTWPWAARASSGPDSEQVARPCWCWGRDPRRRDLLDGLRRRRGSATSTW